MTITLTLEALELLGEALGPGLLRHGPGLVAHEHPQAVHVCVGAGSVSH